MVRSKVVQGTGFDPWSGEIPHAMEQLEPVPTRLKPLCPEPALCNRDVK